MRLMGASDGAASASAAGMGAAIVRGVKRARKVRTKKRTMDDGRENMVVVVVGCCK